MKSFVNQQNILIEKALGADLDTTKDFSKKLTDMFAELKLPYKMSNAKKTNQVAFPGTRYLEIQSLNGKKYGLQSVDDAVSIFNQINVKVKKVDFDDDERKAITGGNDVYRIYIGRKYVLAKGPPHSKKPKGKAGEQALPKITNKSLAPDMCGIPLDKELSKRAIVTAANKAIKRQGFPKKQEDFLLGVIEKVSANKSWNDIDLSADPPKDYFAPEDLARFAVDFGEVLAGIALTNVFDTVRYPKESNYAIADVFVSKKGTENIQGKLVSVKSGAGSGTAFSGFTDTLKKLQIIQSVDGSLRSSQAFHPNNTTKKEFELIDILQTIIDTKAWDATTPLAIEQDTAYVKAYKKVVGSRAKPTHESIAQWVMSHKTPEELGDSLDKIKVAAKMSLTKYNAKALSRLQDAINGEKPEGVVLVSMTNQLATHLTDKYRTELRRVIGKLDAFQFNVNWNSKKTGLSFGFKRLRQLNWKFKFAGNSKMFQNKISFVKESVEVKGFATYIKETYADSGIGKWMKQSAGGEPGWDRYNTKGERVGKCGDSDDGDAYAACLSPAKAKKLGKAGIADFVKRKRAAQKKSGDSKKGGESKKGQKPVNVDTKANEETITEKNEPTNPKLWKQAIAKAKSKFDVYPSAYANAWASKWYKEQGGGWRKVEEECDCDKQVIEESEYQGKKVKLNDPFRTSGKKKKFAVYVKNESGTVVIVRFGDPNMEIKRDDPARRKSFRARHNCADPGPKWKARYWSCYQWRGSAKVDS